MTSVVAAIDFGTHGTGYAWTEVTDGDGPLLPVRPEPNYRERWPGTDSRYPKDLSAVLLDPGGQVTAWGHEARHEWARLSLNGASAGYGYVAGFKMALKADLYHGLGAPGAGSAQIDSVAKAYPLVVSCLRRVYQMALREIGGSGYLDSQIRWCLTVPAIWDEPEKQLMRDAAAEAGLPADRDRLLLALEPEAAAVYCRTHLARVVGGGVRERQQLVEPGTRFMVVDCGGGTVDITAFRVVTDGYGTDRMVEIGKVSGGKLGSEYINEEFVRRVLHSRLGGAEVVEQLRRECPYALLELVERWESQKVTAQVRATSQGPVIDRPIYLPVPGEVHDLLPEAAIGTLAAQPGGNPHRIVVSPEEAGSLFDGVIDHIIEEIHMQLGAMADRDGPGEQPERILLVGGLSGSEYLQDRLRWFLDAQPAPLNRARVLVPANPAAAVLFGAVLYACDPAVIPVRRARYTYGCRFDPPFEPGLDRPEKRFTDSAGVVRCQDRFNVLVREGDRIEADQRVTDILLPVHADTEKLRLRFYRTSSREPRYIDDPGCEEIGTLAVDLGSAMHMRLDQRRVETQVMFGDTDISARAVNVHSGQRVETVLRFKRLG